MAFHLELFSSSIASGANTFAQLTYVQADAILPSQNNGLTVISDLPYLHSVFGVGAHLVHMRAQANSMLPMPYITIDPGNRGTAFESPPRVWDISQAPRKLRITEEFDVFASQNSGGSETEYVAAQFTDGPPMRIPVTLNPPGLDIVALTPGQFVTAHAAASATLTAGAFTQVTPSFDQTLPAGTYGIIGCRVFSATGLFFRMFPATGPKWRPGGHCVQAYDGIDQWGQRAIPWGGQVLAPWGVWLTFYQNVPPKVEIFATSADTAEEFDFDLVYLGQGVMGG
jgi:hypothetical protein